MTHHSLINSNSLQIPLADQSVHCVVTSPPYWSLRDYGIEGQLGLETTPDEYVANMVAVFREVWRVLRDDGTVWLNLGDSYAGSNNGSNDYRVEGSSISKNNNKYQGQKTGNVIGLKPKDLAGIPWRVAFALQADGWYLRSDIIWSKPNPMPESVRDRPTKSHEYVFLLSKSARYYWDQDAVREPHESPIITKRTWGNKHANRLNNRDNRSTSAGILNPSGRNIRTVWNIATQPYSGAHFATFPQKLVEPCVKAGCPEGGTVLDPFGGSGTTLLVARQLGRNAIGLDLSFKYLQLARERLGYTALDAWTNGNAVQVIDNAPLFEEIL